MKTPMLFLSLILLVGCKSLEFQPYVGQQQNWKTQNGTIVRQKDGINIYCSGFPEKPYKILGMVKLVDQNPEVMAKAVKEHGGDAAIITDARLINMGTRFVPGMSFTFGGGNIFGNSFNQSSYTFTTPGRVEQITRFTANGYVIKFRDPIEAKLEELHMSIEWLNAYPKGGTVEGVTFTEEQVKAAQEKLHGNFTEWFKWCDDHQAGGTIPDGKGGVINIPSDKISLIRVALQQEFQIFQQGYNSKP